MTLIKADLILVLHPPTDQGDTWQLLQERNVVDRYLAGLGAEYRRRDIFNLTDLLSEIREGLKHLYGQSEVGMLYVHYCGYADLTGIRLRDGAVSWPELREKLLSVEENIQQFLVLVMSTSNGAEAKRMVLPDEDAPFLLMLGSTRTENWSEAFLATVVFYQGVRVGSGPPHDPEHVGMLGDMLQNRVNAAVAPSEKDRWIVCTPPGLI